MARALEAPSQPISSTLCAHGSASPATIGDDGLSAFLSVRRRLFGIAYRMLGSAAEAEDVVQDVWLRWQTANRSLVRDAAAFLATTTTRVAINVLQSSRTRRETSVGPGLPEPADGAPDPLRVSVTSLTSRLARYPLPAPTPPLKWKRTYG